MTFKFFNSIRAISFVVLALFGPITLAEEKQFDEFNRKYYELLKADLINLRLPGEFCFIKAWAMKRGKCRFDYKNSDPAMWAKKVFKFSYLLGSEDELSDYELSDYKLDEYTYFVVLISDSREMWVNTCQHARLIGFVDTEICKDAIHFMHNLEGEYITLLEVGVTEEIKKLEGEIIEREAREELAEQTTHLKSPEPFDRTLYEEKRSEYKSLPLPNEFCFLKAWAMRNDTCPFDFANNFPSLWVEKVFDYVNNLNEEEALAYGKHLKDLNLDAWVLNSLSLWVETCEHAELVQFSNTPVCADALVFMADFTFEFFNKWALN